MYTTEEKFCLQRVSAVAAVVVQLDSDGHKFNTNLAQSTAVRMKQFQLFSSLTASTPLSCKCCDVTQTADTLTVRH